jgi:hypothetical protein
MKPLLRFFSFALLAVLSSVTFAQQGQSPLPELPPDIPKDATIWMFLTNKMLSARLKLLSKAEL